MSGQTGTHGSRKAKIGVFGLALMIVLAVVGPAIAPYSPDATSSAILQGPSSAHLLGTTSTGQDVLSQLLVGAWPSLFVGFLAASIATILSVIFGILSGYLGGAVGETFTLTSNVFLVLPTLPLLIVLTGYLPNSSFALLAVVIGLTGWAWGARVIRAQTLSLKNRDYITAARATGEKLWRITWFELMPGLLPVIASTFLFTVAYAIVTQAGLDFLGLGRLSQWTWGTMLYWAQNDGAFLSGAWWWYVPPGLAIALVGLLLAFVNFDIDERVNRRLRVAPSRRVRGSQKTPSPRQDSVVGGGSTADSIVPLLDGVGRTSDI